MCIAHVRPAAIALHMHSHFIPFIAWHWGLKFAIIINAYIKPTYQCSHCVSPVQNKMVLSDASSTQTDWVRSLALFFSAWRNRHFPAIVSLSGSITCRYHTTSASNQNDFLISSNKTKSYCIFFLFIANIPNYLQFQRLNFIHFRFYSFERINRFCGTAQRENSQIAAPCSMFRNILSFRTIELIIVYLVIDNKKKIDGIQWAPVINRKDPFLSSKLCIADK